MLRTREIHIGCSWFPLKLLANQTILCTCFTLRKQSHSFAMGMFTHLVFKIMLKSTVSWKLVQPPMQFYLMPTCQILVKSLQPAYCKWGWKARCGFHLAFWPDEISAPWNYLGLDMTGYKCARDSNSSQTLSRLHIPSRTELCDTKLQNYFHLCYFCVKFNLI